MSLFVPQRYKYCIYLNGFIFAFWDLFKIFFFIDQKSFILRQKGRREKREIENAKEIENK